jgi:hypothetical protein
MICKFNIGSRWNGYGAIDGVLNKSSDAPMVYRVLVPWLIGRNIKLWKYNIIQTVLIYIAIISLWKVWCLNVTLITMILITLTFWYDYWDWTVELTSLSFSLVSFPLALFGALALGLSRETAPLVGIVYALHSHDYLGGLLISLIAILTLLIVHKVQGKHKLYCDRWMYKVNWKLIKSGDVKTWLSIGIILLYLPMVFIRQDAIGLLPIVLTGLTMAKINETRVFVAIVPYAAYFINGLIK